MTRRIVKKQLKNVYEESFACLESPGRTEISKNLNHWVVDCEIVTNREMLKAARFIARWNGMKLVKEE